jgi:signal transduction histidine kinase
MLVTYLIIIMTVVIVLSLAITQIYKWYVFDTKQKELETAAYQTDKLATMYVDKKLSKTQLNNSLDSMGYISDTKIYIVSIDKASLKNPKTLKLGEGLEEGYVLSDLEAILDGNTVFHKNQYSKEFDMYIVFMGVPWKTGDNISGAILFFSPVKALTDNITKINIIIWLIALILILLSIVATYINAKRISRPIFKMEQAARKIALGQATGDVVIKTNDEIEKLANSFNHMRKQIEDTEKIRREFIASVSHDLRTPLTSINGFIEAMQDGVVGSEEHAKYLRIIHEETSRLSRLTDEILQLAKLQSGSIKLHREKFMIREIMETVLSSTKILIEEKEILFSTEFDAELEVYADRDRLKQILINIVGNAIKYTEKSGIVSLKVVDMFSRVQFRVKDTGIGISSQDLPFIFEKFYRADKSRHSNRGGTGLGLNIVKSLVELHGGEIWVNSEIGSGTEIIFEISS